MFYKIQAERDLTLIDHTLGGWGGLGDPGEYRYEKTKTDERADAFSIVRSVSRDMIITTLVKRFSTREKAENHLRKICKRPSLVWVK